MSRTIAAPLLAHLQGPVLNLATCAKVSRTDGVVFGLTTCDRNLTLSGVTYEAMDSVSASSLRQSASTGVDNLDVEGVLSSSRITDTDILAGRYDGALIELFVVNWAENPLVNRVIFVTGTIGEITFSEGTYRAEFRSLSQRLSQQIGQITTATCRVRQLGDAECKANVASVAISAVTNANPGQVTTGSAHGYTAGLGVYFYGLGGMTELNLTTRAIKTVTGANTFTLMDLNGNNLDTTGFGVYTAGGTAGYRFTRTVASVTSPNVLTFAADLNISGFYNYGRVHFNTGANAGFEREVKSHANASGQAQLTLQEAFPFAAAVADQALLEGGCDRTLDNCFNKFGNVINLHGEPWIPGNERLLRWGRR